MLKKILRLIMALIGIFIGYGASVLCHMYMIKKEIYLTEGKETAITFAFAIVFGIIFYTLTPLIKRIGEKLADNIGDDIKSTSVEDIMVSVAGLITGLIIAFLITQVFRPIENPYIYGILVALTYIIMSFLGVVIAMKKGREIFSRIRKVKKDNDSLPFQMPTKKKPKYEGTPKIFDTSVIIDGRILEVLKTGFLEGQIVIPEFVLVELRHIADSADSLKRIRGRRGLDILNKIKKDYGVEIYNTDGEKSLKGIPEVDVKLLKLAQIMGGKVVTNDFNLNKVAGINGVGVLNINELANTLKPVVLPGETMNVDLVKEGKEPMQAVAYLDDGTMIVVEDGRRMLGQNTDIVVTSVLQTSAGRMIFGRLR